MARNQACDAICDEYGKGGSLCHLGKLTLHTNIDLQNTKFFSSIFGECLFCASLKLVYILFDMGKCYNYIQAVLQNDVISCAL